MRKYLFRSLLVTMLSTFVAGSHAFGCGTYGEPDPKFENVVVVANQFFAIDAEGNLVSIDLQSKNERSYGTLHRPLLPHLDAQGDRACVLTSEEICEVDLESGKILRTQKHDMGNCRVGIIDQDKVFLHNGRKLSIMDLNSGKTLSQIDLKCDEKTCKLSKIGPTGHSRAGHLLYVVRPFTHGVAVVDLQKGEFVKEINANGYGWTTNVHASGDNLFVCETSVSYGIVYNALCLIDLKTEKKIERIGLDGSRMKFGADISAAPTTMIGSEDGGVILTVENGLARYDAKGRLVSQADDIRQAKDLPVARLIALRNDTAVVADANSVRLVQLTSNKLTPNK